MSIAASLSNNITTSGVVTADAVNNTSCNNITTFASIPAGGSLVLLSTQTASASASIEFTSGIDSTYDSYVFKFINIHPQTDAADFQFNMSTDGGSTYAVTKTTTNFIAYHFENDTAAVLDYNGSYDLAQSTAYQTIGDQVGAGADESISGTLQLFNPSSTTFVKHFINTANKYQYSDISINEFQAGYGNTTSAVDAVAFKFSTGNIDDGIIKMYGVK